MKGGSRRRESGVFCSNELRQFRRGESDARVRDVVHVAVGANKRHAEHPLPRGAFCGDPQLDQALARVLLVPDDELLRWDDELAAADSRDEWRYLLTAVNVVVEALLPRVDGLQEGLYFFFGARYLGDTGVGQDAPKSNHRRYNLRRRLLDWGVAGNPPVDGQTQKIEGLVFSSGSECETGKTLGPRATLIPFRTFSLYSCISHQVFRAMFEFCSSNNLL